ncbi:hypothetical protein BsIDN1_28350 [Bacillus safensis]|uniref:P-type ATPase A domain-containing protein n=1 Tax=Bacillus safensis TaxID=561879 RepID=A0A5S9M6T0_BACIA|nr:hypothetical protein BsIDN1_28350 [Bacillus safensis]
MPGDIVKFSSGDRIGADIRLLETKSLEIEESALTGESIPAVKHASPLSSSHVSLGDLTNMAFMGTLVTRGSGVGVVIGTGMNTAMGQIAGMLDAAGNMGNAAAKASRAARENSDDCGCFIFNGARSGSRCCART